MEKESIWNKLTPQYKFVSITWVCKIEHVSSICNITSACLFGSIMQRVLLYFASECIGTGSIFSYFVIDCQSSIFHCWTLFYAASIFFIYPVRLCKRCFYILHPNVKKKKCSGISMYWDQHQIVPEPFAQFQEIGIDCIRHKICIFSIRIAMYEEFGRPTFRPKLFVQHLIVQSFSFKPFRPILLG